MGSAVLELQRKELAYMVRILPDDKVTTVLGIVRDLCERDETMCLMTLLGDKLSVEKFLERKRAGQLPDCINETYGMYSDGMTSVDEFLKRKHADKELEL